MTRTRSSIYILMSCLALMLMLSLTWTLNVYADENIDYAIEQSMTVDKPSETDVIDEEPIPDDETPLTSFDWLEDDPAAQVVITVAIAAILTGAFIAIRRRRTDRYSELI